MVCFENSFINTFIRKTKREFYNSNFTKTKLKTMNKLILIATLLMTFNYVNAQTVKMPNGDYEVTCKRSWQECTLCNQKKEFVYRVKNFKGDDSKTVEYCVEYILVNITKRLNLQFELAKKMTMIYPEFTETVYMAPDKCEVSKTGNHSFVTKSAEFVEKFTAVQHEKCKNQ